MTEPRPEPTGATSSATSSAADPTRPAGATPAPTVAAPAPTAASPDPTAAAPDGHLPTSQLPTSQPSVDRTPTEQAPTDRPTSPEPGDPVDPSPRDRLSDQTTTVTPLPERHRDETLPGTSRGEHVPPHRTTWSPDSDVDRTTPAWSTQPVAVRRADPFAAFLLVLAGVAAGVSLLLPWTPDGPTGWDLLREGIDQLSGDWTGVFDNGLWQPLAVVGGGALLFVLGLLVLIPAKAHRFFGVLALLVALVVIAAVLVPLADARWDLGSFDLGFYAAIGVAGLGVLGALKAALTGRKHA